MLSNSSESLLIKTMLLCFVLLYLRSSISIFRKVLFPHLLIPVITLITGLSINGLMRRRYFSLLIISKYNIFFVKIIKRLVYSMF
jgi:hypothetical protein